MPRALIVGGLTVDRFTDGTSAPGGSVLHAGRAAAAEGADLIFLTVAGDEPEAGAGVEALASMGAVVTQSAPSTVTYGHAEMDGRRVLTLLTAATPITPADVGEPPDVAMLAPIADELPARAVDELLRATRPRLTVMLIQGWLRRLVVGESVHPLPLDEVPADVWRAVGKADAVVVSTEDLADAPEDPFAQVRDLRTRLGDGPLLLLTLGTEGYLLDDPGADRVVGSMPRRVVTGVPTVGAGDTFGAALGLALAGKASPEIAAEAASDAVIHMLESRAA